MPRLSAHADGAPRLPGLPGLPSVPSPPATTAGREPDGRRLREITCRLLRSLAPLVSLVSLVPLVPLLCALTLPFLAGCAGYRLGPTNGSAAGARSVQVLPFHNRTIEPRLVESIAFALRKELQQDGTFTLDTDNSGDVVVGGTILDYERQQLSLQPRDALTPRDYRITITVQLVATERSTGKILVDRKVKGYSDIRIGPDLASAERQALPLVTEDLARSVTALLADGSW